VGLTGTLGEQAGALPTHAMFALVVASSVNMTSPPATIVTLLAGSGLDPEPGPPSTASCSRRSFH
jgi:hypothetical protein